LPIVLLDADVIIDLHRFEIWEHIVTRNNILIPSTVLRQEAIYFIDEFGNKLGETEGLKILNDRDDCYFCTCDKAAIKVVALLGKREQGMSFEKLSTLSGYNKRFENKHTEIYFKKYLDEGSLLRIQRFGIKE